MIKTKYLILCWILVLIVFTFFCIYRIPLYIKNNKKKQSIYNNFYNITVASALAPAQSSPLIPSSALAPETSQSQEQELTQEQEQSPEVLKTIPLETNIIQYIDNIAKNDKIIDIPQCENVYDDNVAVRSIGYNNCKTANADYFTRNLDSKKKYGYNKSLSDLCPVSTNSDKYVNCMQKILTKFNTNANIVNKINNDMTGIINDRIRHRDTILDNIETTINPDIYSKEQQDFNINMILGEPKNLSVDQIAEHAITYYNYKYGNSKSIFTNINNNTNTSVNTISAAQSINNVLQYNKQLLQYNKQLLHEKFTTNIDIYTIDPYIKTMFFGFYMPIKGQYLVFNNVSVSLTYEIENQQMQQENQATYVSSDNNTQQVYKVFLTIIDNNTKVKIIYSVINIDYYLHYKNIIKIDILNKVISNTDKDTDKDTLNDSNALQQLLITLGIITPCTLLMSISEFTSSEHITRQTYKLLNLYLNTIMSLEKNIS